MDNQAIIMTGDEGIGSVVSVWFEGARRWDRVFIMFLHVAKRLKCDSTQGHMRVIVPC